MKKYCENCGKRLQEGGKFCPRCGGKVPEEAGSVCQTELPTNTQRSGRKMSASRQKKRKRWSTGQLVVLALVFLGVGGYLGWHIWVGSTHPEDETGLTAQASLEEVVGRSTEIYLPGYSPVSVTDAQTALEALAGKATAYGIENAEEEYQLYTEMEAAGLRVYWFQQYYQGVEVYGSGLKVIAGEDGSLQMINGNYANVETVDISFPVSQEQAETMVAAYLQEHYRCGADAVAIGALRQLILLSGKEGNISEKPVAAWRAEAAVDGIGLLELFLDGSTGDVLAENPLLREVGLTEASLEGESGTVTLDVYQDGDDYLLWDTERNICVSNGAYTDKEFFFDEEKK